MAKLILLFSLFVLTKACWVDLDETVNYPGKCVRLGRSTHACQGEEYLDILNKDCDVLSKGATCSIAITTFRRVEGKCVKIGSETSLCKISDNSLYVSLDC